MVLKKIMGERERKREDMKGCEREREIMTNLSKKVKTSPIPTHSVSRGLRKTFCFIQCTLICGKTYKNIDSTLYKYALYNMHFL